MILTKPNGLHFSMILILALGSGCATGTRLTTSNPSGIRIPAAEATFSKSFQQLVSEAQADIRAATKEEIIEGLSNEWNRIQGGDSKLPWENRIEALQTYLSAVTWVVQEKFYGAESANEAARGTDQAVRELVIRHLSEYKLSLSISPKPAEAPVGKEADLKAAVDGALEKLIGSMDSYTRAAEQAAGWRMQEELRFETSLFDLAIAVQGRMIVSIDSSHSKLEDLSGLKKQLQADQEHYEIVRELLKTIVQAGQELTANKRTFFEKRREELLKQPYKFWADYAAGTLSAPLGIEQNKQGYWIDHDDGDKIVRFISQETAIKMQTLLKSSGILYLKLIQTLSRSGRLPRELAEVTQIFQKDNEAKMTYEQVIEHLRAEWGVDPHEVVEFIGEKKDAAGNFLTDAVGTVGQVYKVKFKKGMGPSPDLEKEPFALKIIMPELQTPLESGRKSLPAAARVLKSILPSSFASRLDDIASSATGLAREISYEFDARTEEKNLIALSGPFKGDKSVKFPASAPKWTRKTVLLTQWVNEQTLGEVLSKLSLSDEEAAAAKLVKLSVEVRKRLVKNLAYAYLTMVLTGKVHADLQGGNALVDNNGGVTLLDTGNIVHLRKGWISEWFRAAMTGKKSRIVDLIMNSGELNEIQGETQDGRAERLKKVRQYVETQVDAENYSSKWLITGLFNKESWKNLDRIRKLKARILQDTEKQFAFVRDAREIQMWRAQEPLFGAVTQLVAGIPFSELTPLLLTGPFEVLSKAVWSSVKHNASPKRWWKDSVERRNAQAEARKAARAAKGTETTPKSAVGR